MVSWTRWVQCSLGLFFLASHLYAAEKKVMGSIPSTQDLNAPQNLALLKKKAKKTLTAAHMELLQVFYFTEVEGEVRFVVYMKRPPEVNPHIVKKKHTTMVERGQLMEQFSAYWLCSKEPEKLRGGQATPIEVLEVPSEGSLEAALTEADAPINSMYTPLGNHNGLLLHQQSDWRAHLQSSKSGCILQ